MDDPGMSMPMLDPVIVWVAGAVVEPQSARLRRTDGA